MKTSKIRHIISDSSYLQFFFFNSLVIKQTLNHKHKYMFWVINSVSGRVNLKNKTWYKSGFYSILRWKILFRSDLTKAINSRAKIRLVPTFLLLLIQCPRDNRPTMNRITGIRDQPIQSSYMLVIVRSRVKQLAQGHMSWYQNPNFENALPKAQSPYNMLTERYKHNKT